eukprot:30864-Pelagococcus_subviridis.AAC.4
MYRRSCVETLRYRRHHSRAVNLVRLAVAVFPVPLLALSRAVPYAAAQLARPVRVLSAPGAAAELLQECFDLRDGIFSDVTSNIVAAFLHPEQCDFEYVLRKSNVFLEAAQAVEKTQRDVVELVHRPVFGRRSEHKRNSGLGAEAQAGDTNDERRHIRRRQTSRPSIRASPSPLGGIHQYRDGTPYRTNIALLDRPSPPLIDTTRYISLRLARLRSRVGTPRRAKTRRWRRLARRHPRRSPK